MKTTVEISDALLAEVRQVAARQGMTLRRLVEAGLRRILEEQSALRDFKLRDASVPGQGLAAEFAEGGWERVREAVYEGRGG